MEMNRVLILGEDKKLRRVCKFGHDKDKKNEGYLKFSFPDLQGKLCFSRDVPINEELIEFSYHFDGGVSHFKSRQGGHIKQKINLIKLGDTTLIYLFKYIIYDLDNFKVYRKNIEVNDLKLKDPFNLRKGRVIEFYLGHSKKNAIIPEIRSDHSEYENIRLHPYAKEVDDIRLLLVELDFKEKPMEKTGLSIFRPDEPGVEFIEYEQ